MEIEMRSFIKKANGRDYKIEYLWPFQDVEIVRGQTVVVPTEIGRHLAEMMHDLNLSQG